ncbi:UDP-Glc:alpha-D-GlcNAc-diphosphoundecaprenol beta-1,3-glucosyltransferase WfgD [Arthrobacter saudimassiliensis]|uniref:UDP-Glc:alpha-D-GlcNAc-diphosphoundecaprenol beta-1,3-glucosyltransferase WfgD n=1 Tax=Arthrobacter saudimassiliensis TaxID=1461584 RepID=A0A078MTD5_9MICC|nr:UDP-Glc:alpha-D-GlcNAc-diphosphoundecaprenol beta-1,3-glucosyltransferase WfgD [Arthrobacter saudimassiliensis]
MQPEDAVAIDGDAPVPRVSVCMAAYRGTAFIEEQIRSILAQLAPSDELVVVDDASPDDTAVTVKDIDDPRIRLYTNDMNRGYVRTFERALGLARGRYLFLADQDDVWLPGRVESMIAALSGPSGAGVVAGNFGFLGASPRRIESLRLKGADSRRRVANLLALWIGVRPYYGCAMAMTMQFRNQALPFPPFLTETHDQWIAMVGILHGQMKHLEQDTLLRRLHGDNATPRTMRSPSAILRARLMLARAFVVALRRRPA